MICEYTKDNRELTIKFSGEIDHHTCDVIKVKSDYEIQKYMPKKVVFDFKDVKFMDSSGIGMLIGRYKQILRIGGQAEMVHTSKDIKRIFEMSGIFKIIPLREEASL
ncbi:MAG: anti-sigma factor antagonist [Clostridia bacterium]|nr:anti-sigma factor antagonist [Clostridia bacterium]